jgi:hypothetical protein
LRSLAGGTVKSDILEGGLILVVAVSIVSIAPAVWSHNADLVRAQALQLALAALATALSLVERNYARPVKVDVPAAMVAPAR